MKAFIVYAKPCTTITAHWCAIASAVCKKELHSGHYIFKSLIEAERTGYGPCCVICKNNDHFASACTLANDPQWWGPKTQINGYTEGPLAARGRGRGTAAEGNHVGNNGNNRGGNQGAHGGHGRGGLGRGGT
jgi:hypothetical protein